MAINKVFPGDPRGRPSARAHNELVDAIATLRQLPTGGAGQASPPRRSSGFIRVQNATGGDRDRGQVVGLEAPLFKPSDDEDAFLERVQFVGVAADAEIHGSKFAILLEPLAADDVGWAAVSGVVPALISVGDEGHSFAELGSDAPKLLKSSGSGPVRILWKETGKGTKKAYVYLGPTADSGFRIRNETGKDLELGQVVGIDYPIHHPGTDRTRRPAYFDDYDTDDVRKIDLFEQDAGDMVGVKPAARHVGRFAITSAAIKKWETGPAVASGVAICKVTFPRNGQFEFADVSRERPTVESLTACPVGAAQILWAGSPWAIVRVGSKVQQGFRGILLGKLEMGKSARVQLLRDGMVIEAFDHMLVRGESMEKDTKVWLGVEDGIYYVVEGSCPADD
jgi:hypothetical protein